MDKDAQSPQNRRTLKGMLVKPRRQLTIIFGMITALLVLGSGFSASVLMALHQLVGRTFTAHGVPPELALQIQGYLVETAIYTSLAGLGISVFAAYMGLVYSHRVYGPQLPFLRHVQALMQGDFSTRIVLRKSDEFHELKEALNALAEHLEKQKSAS